MANTNENVTIKLGVEPEMKGWNQMKREMMDLRQKLDEAAAAGDKISFNRISKELGIVRNEFAELKAVMKYLDPKELLNGWVKVGKGIAGGFEAALGASELFGAKQEEIEKVQRETMGIIKLMMGLEEVRAVFLDRAGQAELKGILTNTGAQLKRLFVTEAEVVATETQTVATEGGVVAQEAMNVAMVANPVGIILVAVVALAAALVIFAHNANKASFEQEALNKANEKAGEKTADERVNLDLLTKSLLNANVKGKERKELIDKYNEDFGKYSGNLLTEKSTVEDIAKAHDEVTKALMKEAQAEAIKEQTVELYKEMNELKQAEVKIIHDKYRLDDAGTAIALKADGKKVSIENIRALQLIQQKQKEVEIQEKINKLMDLNKDAALDEAGIKANEDKIKKEEEALKKSKEDYKKFLEDKKAATEKYELAEEKARVEATKTKIDDLKLDYKYQIKALDDTFKKKLISEELYNANKKALDDKLVFDIQTETEKENEEALKKQKAVDDKAYAINKGSLEAELTAHKDNINAKIALKELEKAHDLDDAQLTADEKKNIEMVYQSEIADLRKEASENEKKRILDEINYEANQRSKQVDMTQKLTEAMSNFAILAAGKNQKEQLRIQKIMFKADKAFNVAKATIDGIRSVQAALTLPPPASYALAAFNGILAAGNIAKILSQKFTGDEGGGSSASVSTSTSAPRVTSSLDQLQHVGTPTMNNPLSPQAPGNNNGTNQPQKVYVVSQDLTKQQNADAVLQRRASFKK